MDKSKNTERITCSGVTKEETENFGAWCIVQGITPSRALAEVIRAIAKNPECFSFESGIKFNKGEKK